jgi:hypothetical protein
MESMFEEADQCGVRSVEGDGNVTDFDDDARRQRHGGEYIVPALTGATGLRGAVEDR